jgi:anaerobic C4-dicarboxylate transporter
MVWVKQALNAIIILCIPVGLYFAWCVLSSDITAADWQERLATGNWSEDALSRLQEREFNKMAARWTFYVFIASALVLIILRSGLLGSGKRPSRST